MHGVKGCFVCRQDTLARQQRSRDNITATIERLKCEHSNELSTVEKLSVIYHIVNVYSDFEVEGRTDWGRWAGNDATENKDIAPIAYEDGK